MGTQGISNLVNDLTLMNVDIPKGNESNGEFAKTFENASGQSDIEALAKRDVNVVDELKTSDNSQDVKDNFLKETSSKSLDSKVSDKKVTAEKTDASNGVKTNKADLSNVSDEEIEKAAESLITAYCEAFNISEEDMMAFMEENGIEAIDLLDASNVQSLVMELNGITDSVDILTDEAVFDSIKSLEELTENLNNELSEEIADLADGIEVLDVEENAAIQSSVNVKEEETVPVSKNEISSDALSETVKEDAVSLSDIDKTTPTVKKSEQKGENNENTHLTGEQNLNEVKPNEVNVQATHESAEVFSTRAQEIYDQIGEYVRNLSTENLNKIELQLQPETLGTIQVRVTQSEGVMKAELLTTNETVRAAVESQLIQLKEDFERSGLRVEEVEVRVATNEFNEATQQDSRDEENEAASRNTSTRRINISDGIALDEIDEYEEDEKIAVEMMAANGNSMDYKA